MSEYVIPETKYLSQHVTCAKPCFSELVEVKIPEGFNTVKSISFSSSGSGKYFIRVNDDLVATLFGSLKNLNVLYDLPISVSRNDRLYLEYLNMDHIAMDMYSTVQFSVEFGVKL